MPFVTFSLISSVSPEKKNHGEIDQAVPLYLSEMAPPSRRGGFSNGFQLCVGLGSLTAQLVNFSTEKINGGWGWRVSLAVAAVPAGLLTVGALFLPETPNSLVQQGKDHHRVRLLLRKIRGTDVVEDELDDIVKADRSNKATARSGLQMIVSQRRYRPQLVMAVMIPFFQQMTGINAIAFYAPVLLRTVGIGESAALLSVVVKQTIGVGATLVSMFAVDRFGRRTLFLVGGAQMLVSQLMIGALMASQLGDRGEVSKGYALVLIALIAVYQAGFGWSWGPLGWLVPSEIFPLEVPLKPVALGGRWPGRLADLWIQREIRVWWSAVGTLVGGDLVGCYSCVCCLAVRCVDDGRRRRSSSESGDRGEDLRSKLRSRNTRRTYTPRTEGVTLLQLCAVTGSAALMS
jgi:sugar porter (SP) family MFS transporter